MKQTAAGNRFVGCKSQNSWTSLGARAGQLFRQLPMLVEQAGGEHVRNGCARLHFDDGVVAPERRAIVTVIAAILDGQAGVRHHVLRRVERVPVDRCGKALLRREALRAQGALQGR